MSTPDTPLPFFVTPSFAIASADFALSLAGLPTYSDLLRQVPPTPGPLPEGVVAIKDYTSDPSRSRKTFGLRGPQ